MTDYFLWNGDPVIYSNGSLHLYWYAVLIMLAFVLVIYFLKSLTSKQIHLYQRVEYLVISVILVALFFSRWGELIIQPTASLTKDAISGLFPFVLKPDFKFVGLKQLSLPFGIIGMICGAWIYKKSVLKATSFLYVMDRIAIGACLVGSLLFTGNFIQADFLGKPTDAADGTISIRPVTDGLAHLKCCIMRNPDGPNPLMKVLVKKGSTKTSKDIGQKEIEYTLLFKPSIEEREATEFIIGDVKTYLFDHSSYVKESGTEPIKHALTKLPNGTISASITTTGIARHPTQLYLALATLFLFIWFYRYQYKRSDAKVHGNASGWILLSFSMVYIGIYFLTELPVSYPRYFGMVITQWLMAAIALVGVVWIKYSSSKIKA